MRDREEAPDEQHARRDAELDRHGHAAPRRGGTEERAEQGADREAGVELRDDRAPDGALDLRGLDVERHVVEGEGHAVEEDARAHEWERRDADADREQGHGRDEPDGRSRHRAARAEALQDRPRGGDHEQRPDRPDEQHDAELGLRDAEALADRRQARQPARHHDAEEREEAHQVPARGGDGACGDGSGGRCRRGRAHGLLSGRGVDPEVDRIVSRTGQVSSRGGNLVNADRRKFLATSR